MLALALVLIATTTGSGTSKTEKRPLEAFTSVSTLGSFTVDIVKGDALGAEVTADDNIVPLVVTEVKDGVLTITGKDGESFNSKIAVVVKVTAKSLDAVSASGSGRTSVTDVPASAKSIALASSGSGALAWKGAANNVTVKGSGSGTVTLIGKGAALDAALSGSGALDASAFEVAAAKVAVTGSGHAQVNATDELHASVTGAGRILYAGSPRVIKRISGSGDIEAKDAPAPIEKKRASSGW